MTRTRWYGLAAGFLVLSALSLVTRAGAAPSCDPLVVAGAAAAIAAACPCDGQPGPGGGVTAWKNHGGYVSCVVRERNRLAKQLDISKSCIRTAARCAARSTCGKPDGFVICRIHEVCSDTTPDGDPTGTCGDDATIACDTAADCPVLRCSIKSATELCTAQSGISGSGSCCE